MNSRPAQHGTEGATATMPVILALDRAAVGIESMGNSIGQDVEEQKAAYTGTSEIDLQPPRHPAVISHSLFPYSQL